MSTSDTPNPALECPRCGTNCGGGKKLFQHLRRVHGLSTAEASALRPKTAWRCTLCGEEFRGNGLLTRHQESAHGLTTLKLVL